MPFRPTIRRCDSPPSAAPPPFVPIDEMEGDLPRDLAGMGQQLSDDAQWLAQRYPANVCPMEITPRTGGRRFIRWISAAAAILAISGGAWLALRTPPALSPKTLSPKLESIDHFATTARSTLGATPPAARISDRVLDAGEDYILAADLNSPDGLIVPAAFFQNLSGPEQEGLLDLLDEMVPEAIDLSM